MYVPTSADVAEYRRQARLGLVRRMKHCRCMWNPDGTRRCCIHRGECKEN